LHRSARHNLLATFLFAEQHEPARGIFGTNARWDGQGNHWWHYLLFFLCFGFIWMWF
jgi:hypothetical protein